MPVYLLDLPANVLERIFHYFTFEQLSKLRETSQTFNKMCMEMLNSGFRRAENRLAFSLQRVKSQLPRRESERKNHSLARHADTFAAVETRLSLLSMTFRKYIETGGCCFFAGKVLDELNNVQRLVNNSVEVVLVGRKGEQLKPHEILQELRDISSMAMEYFEEQIVPLIKKRNPQAMRNAAAYMCYEFPTSYCCNSPASTSQASTSAAVTAGTSSDEMDNVTLFGDVNRLRKEVRHLSSLVSKYKTELQKVQTEYKTILGQKRKLDDQSRELQEINKRLVAHDNKFNEICSELRSALSERHGQSGQSASAAVALDIAQIQQQPVVVNANVPPESELGPPVSKKPRNASRKFFDNSIEKSCDDVGGKSSENPIIKSSNSSITKKNYVMSAASCGMQLRSSRRISEKSINLTSEIESKSALISSRGIDGDGRKLQPIVEEEHAPGKRRCQRLNHESDDDSIAIGSIRKRERK